MVEVNYYLLGGVVLGGAIGTVWGTYLWPVEPGQFKGKLLVIFCVTIGAFAGLLIERLVAILIR